MLVNYLLGQERPITFCKTFCHFLYYFIIISIIISIIIAIIISIIILIIIAVIISIKSVSVKLCEQRMFPCIRVQSKSNVTVCHLNRDIPIFRHRIVRFQGSTHVL